MLFFILRNEKNVMINKTHMIFTGIMVYTSEQLDGGLEMLGLAILI